MATKIEGSCAVNAAYPGNTYRFTDLKPSIGKSATLVVHDGDTHERLFTESELRAMMDAVKVIATQHSRRCYTSRIEQMTPPPPVVFEIDRYLRKVHDIATDRA